MNKTLKIGKHGKDGKHGKHGKDGKHGKHGKDGKHGKHGKHKSKTAKNQTKSRTHNHSHSHETDFTKLNCAPNPDKTKDPFENQLDFTCYTSKGLLKLKELWNSRHPDAKIETTYPREIWKQLREHMSHSCNNEKCWLQQGFIKNKIDNELLNYTFAPESPSTWRINPTEWLSSLDIHAVMKQYERKFKCFDFIGPSPIDYDKHFVDGDCVWRELCEFSLKSQLEKQKTKIGVIFNLDPHYKDGSHWVSLFINVRKREIYFFDSAGEPPHKQIQKFVDNIISQGEKLGIKFKYFINGVVHQYTTSECGMYSLFFVIQMLYDVPYEKFQKIRVSDDKMRELRKVYFN
jgi:hypothetical protein